MKFEVKLLAYSFIALLL